MRDASALSADDILSPDRYAQQGYPFDAWRTLREQAPLRWFDLEGERPGFWAVTLRADILELSKQPDRFLNAPRLAVFPESPGRGKQNRLVRNLLNMDRPEHTTFRNVSSGWFTPRAIGRRRKEVERITRDLLDALAQNEQADFVEDFAAPLTLSVLAEMLGVPRADWEKMFRWTNRVVGASDPEYQLAATTPSESMEAARDEMFAYFLDMVEQRRREARDDIISVLAHAEIDGAPMPPFELLSYLVLLVAAGNETTRNAASGGLLALIENPAELETLQRNPALVNSAVEEMVRFTSPVIQFCRTPTRDFEMRGQKVRAGESLCLFYASANRDETVFDEPDRFRVSRSPNPHLGFGIGEHFCLGANLARLELRVIFEQLVPRLEWMELAGPFERMRSSFLGGVKRMPVRYKLRQAAA